MVYDSGVKETSFDRSLLNRTVMKPQTVELERDLIMRIFVTIDLY